MAYNAGFAPGNRMSDSCKLPAFSQAQAAAIARSLFALDGNIKALDGERDLNFLIDGDAGKFVLKIANADEDPAMLECQHRVFERLADANVFAQVATARKSINGRDIETLNGAMGEHHACRVLPFIDGRLLAQIGDPSAELLDDLGRQLARLDLALDGFSHPALERPLLWKMDGALDTVQIFLPLIDDPLRHSLVERHVRAFRERLVPRQTDLRRAVIHNDANRNNVLVSEDGGRVVSIIDFGDMVESWLVVEAALAATYAMLDQREPLAFAQALVGGYDAVLPLLDTEIDVLPELIGMRLCMSVSICAHQLTLEPDNEYLAVDVGSSWALLETLDRLGSDAIRDAMFAACGR